MMMDYFEPLLDLRRLLFKALTMSTRTCLERTKLRTETCDPFCIPLVKYLDYYQF